MCHGALCIDGHLSFNASSIGPGKGPLSFKVLLGNAAGSALSNTLHLSELFDYTVTP